jgi:hypothetical protein
MRIFFTPEAEEEAEYCDTWWRENRPATSTLFARELAEAKALILSVPDVGSVYMTIDGQPVLRVLMKRPVIISTTPSNRASIASRCTPFGVRENALVPGSESSRTFFL